MGALTGYKVIELAGIGPAPMGGMILADMGAEVIRIERPGAADPKGPGH
jgi:alpha-methylacyl-CoA racemase